MVSLAERMASNMDFAAFSKADELKKRLWFTVFALIVFRLGTFIPLPGIDPNVLSDIFARNSGGILGMFVSVPICSVLYALGKEEVRRRLALKKTAKPMETKAVHHKNSSEQL